jgi:hypothetical protein
MIFLLLKHAFVFRQNLSFSTGYFQLYSQCGEVERGDTLSPKHIVAKNYNKIFKKSQEKT